VTWVRAQRDSAEPYFKHGGMKARESPLLYLEAPASSIPPLCSQPTWQILTSRLHLHAAGLAALTAAGGGRLLDDDGGDGDGGALLWTVLHLGLLQQHAFPGDATHYGRCGGGVVVVEMVGGE